MPPIPCSPLAVVALTLLCAVSPAPAQVAPPPEVRLLEVRPFEPGRADDGDPLEDLLQELRVAENVRHLEREGRRLALNGIGLEPRFSWPIADLGSGQFETWAISNFVDQNPDYPNQVLDYTCGGRTYDTSAGYNHTGIDIFLYPFPWRMKNRGRVAVVAAAPGQIVDRRDGEPDESCSLSGGISNTIVLEHSDGSQTYYRHFKNGSVTAKQIGDTVARGEYLGKVASSGNSTGPHLHFAARNAAEELIEPYAGICNAQANGLTSWWLTQRRYRDYELVELSTHWATPTDPPCPQPENPRFKRLFGPSEQVIVGAYFRDPKEEYGATLRVLRPGGISFADWSFQHAQERNAVAVFWQFDLPDILLPSWRGRWTLRAQYLDPDGQSVVRERSFWVGVLFADDFELASLTDAGWIVPITLP